MLELEHVELVVGIHHELAVPFPNTFPGICWQHDEVPAFQYLSSDAYQYVYTCMYVFRVVFAGLYVANWSGPFCLLRHFQTDFQESCGNMMKRQHFSICHHMTTSMITHSCTYSELSLQACMWQAGRGHYVSSGFSNRISRNLVATI